MQPFKFKVTTILLISIAYISSFAIDTIPQNSIGFEAGSPPYSVEFLGNLNSTENASLFARFILPWEDAESTKGAYSYRHMEAALKVIAKKGITPIICLTGGNKIYGNGVPSSTDENYIENWLSFAENTAGYLKDSVFIFEIWDNPDLDWQDQSQYAYILKRTSIVIKAVNEKALIIEGGLSKTDIEWQRKLFEYEITPYIDGITVHSDENIGEFRTLMNEQDITDALIVSLSDKISSREALRKWITGLDKMVTLASFNLSGNESLLQKASELIPPSMSHVPVETDRTCFTDIMTGSRLEDIKHIQFFDIENDRFITAYYPEGTVPEEVDYHLNTTNTANPFAKDIVTEDMTAIKFFLPDYEKGTTTITVPVKDYPMFFVYREQVPAEIDAETENLNISAQRIIPVGEIIARSQQFRKITDDRLTHYSADGRIEMHFKIAEVNTTVDLITINNFFFDKEVGMEWEQKEIYINGIKWKKKTLPELPLIQPEKVAEVPLDIHLDKNYKYRLEGTDNINGNECYKISFEPENGEKSLYRGVVWIDKKNFAQRKIYSIQTNLEKPVISNAQTNYFNPVVWEDGNTYWLMDKIEGQQIFSTGGRNTVVTREVFFSGFSINNRDFHDRKQAAYNSDNQILRDTEKGLRYVVKKDGERVVKEGETKSSLLGMAGAFYDSSLDYPLPLIGFNYFNFDFRDTGAQINFLFGGVMGTLNVTDADFLGSRFELGADAFIFGIPLTDKEYDSLGNEIEYEKIKYLTQSVNINLGLPVAEYGKLRLSYGCNHKSFKTHDDTHREFVMPESHFAHTAKLQARYDRKGYSVELWGSYTKRSRWEEWGMLDSGVYEENHDQYEGYGFTLGKEFFLPYFQKAGITIDGMKGHHLDRFSKYGFNFFGNRVRGFSGSGIRFDEGILAKTYYGFNLGEVIRFDIYADYAKTKDMSIAYEYLDHFGAGIAGSFIGPWNTIINIDYGYGISSDVKQAEGESEFRAVILKVF